MISALQRHKSELLVAALVLMIVGPLVHQYRTQQASRYALTAAVYEEHTLRLDDYTQVLGIDRSVYEGHTYSDKAPGQPLLAVPFYALYRWAGGQSGNLLQVDENLGLWWLTLWFAMIPGAALAALMYRHVREIIPDVALPAALGMALGTMLLPFSALLFGHVLAALLGYAAWLLLYQGGSPCRTVASGALLGAAVTVDYTMVIIAVIVGVYVAGRSWRKVGWYVAGGIPFAMGLGLYNWVVFGSPIVLSYQLSAFSSVPDSARQVTAVFAGIHPERLIELFLAPRGFLIATPIVVLGLAGLVMMARREGLRIEAGVAAAVFFGFLMIPVMWGNPWGGDSPGARYMVPALPFLALPVALVWRRVPKLASVAAAIGIVTLGLATLTYPLLPRDIGFGVTTWLGLATTGEWVPTLLSMWIGDWGWLLHAGIVVAVLASLGYASRQGGASIQSSVQGQAS